MVLYLFLRIHSRSDFFCVSYHYKGGIKQCIFSCIWSFWVNFPLVHCLGLGVISWTPCDTPKEIDLPPGPGPDLAQTSFPLSGKWRFVGWALKPKNGIPIISHNHGSVENRTLFGDLLDTSSGRTPFCTSKVWFALCFLHGLLHIGIAQRATWRSGQVEGRCKMLQRGRWRSLLTRVGHEVCTY